MTSSQQSPTGLIIQGFSREEEDLEYREKKQAFVAAAATAAKMTKKNLKQKRRGKKRSPNGDPM